MKKIKSILKKIDSRLFIWANNPQAQKGIIGLNINGSAFFPLTKVLPLNEFQKEIPNLKEKISMYDGDQNKRKKLKRKIGDYVRFNFDQYGYIIKISKNNAIIQDQNYLVHIIPIEKTIKELIRSEKSLL